MNKKATLILPTGVEIYLEEFDMTLADMIGIAQETLDDSDLVPENFGALKYFFFVNTTTGSMIEQNLDLSRPLSTLFINDRDIIELRMCKPKPQPDGSVLNPMRGVTMFVT